MHNISKITDVSGDYYAGMTLKQCKILELSTKTFNKIDKNRDGVLSADEIILRRKKESRNYKLTSLGGLIMTSLALLGEVGLNPKTGSLGFDKFDKFVLPPLFCLALGAIGYRGIKIDKETNEMKREIKG